MHFVWKINREETFRFLKRGIAIKEYHYKDYNIRIKEVPPDVLASTEHKKYDKRILFVESDFNKVIELEIEHDGKISTVLMVVPYYTPLTSFLAPHKCGLFMMLNDILCVFAPENLSIIRQMQIDSIGTMFEVHPLGDDYILYGEVVIYRIDQDLNVKWEFFGRDIFVKAQGNAPAFVLKDDRICLYDFEGNYYEIDLEGRPIPSTDY